MTAPDLAQRLRGLADRVRRLPPPSRHDPEAFHEARSDLAADLRRLARDAEGAAEPPRACFVAAARGAVVA